MSARLPESIRPALEAGIPSMLVTCSAAGVPNATLISQVYWVDPEHVALSFQFFSKTVRNVRENPHAALGIIDYDRQCHWLLQVDYSHSETEGPVFEAMDMQIEAIASATGMAGIFKLKAADIYRVRAVREI